MKNTNKQISSLLSNTKSLLVIMPHPDDESMYTGGLLMQAKKHKLKIYVITLTRGEKSSLRYFVNKNDDLGEIRGLELIKALKVLKVDRSFTASFPDGALELNSQDISLFIQEKINSLKPSIVVTLEPDGIYGHPDHIATSTIVTDIYKQKPEFKLIYATIPQEYIIDEGSKSMAQREIHPIKHNLILSLNFLQYLNKRKALKMHRSQFYKHTDLSFKPRCIKQLKYEHYFLVE